MARSAFAIIRGSREYSNIKGTVYFTKVPGGTWVDVTVTGLPHFARASGGGSPVGPFGFHLHDGGHCEPESGDDVFSQAKGHYNPDNQPHGNHAGDFPVLFSNNGYARMGFFTNRFNPDEIIGKTVIIHLNPDDYRTEPAGNSGKRIACGVVQKM